MFLEIRMYRRHCWETTLKYLVPYCLWLWVLPLVQLVPPNTSCFGNVVQRHAGTQRQGSGFSALLGNKQSFQKFRECYMNIKTQLMKIWFNMIYPQWLFLREWLLTSLAAWEKLRPHPGAWVSIYTLTSMRCQPWWLLYTSKHKTRSFRLAWI